MCTSVTKQCVHATKYMTLLNATRCNFNHTLAQYTEFTHFLPRDASAERGEATVSRLSICLSVTFVTPSQLDILL